MRSDGTISKVIFILENICHISFGKMTKEYKQEVDQNFVLLQMVQKVSFLQTYDWYISSLVAINVIAISTIPSLLM